MRWPYALASAVLFAIALVLFASASLVANNESYTTWSNSGAFTLLIPALILGAVGIGCLVAGVLRHRR